MHQFDHKLASALEIAQTEAIKRMNPQLEPAHLFFGLVQSPKAKVYKSFKKQKAQIKKHLETLPVVSDSEDHVENFRPSPALGQLITHASAECIQAGRQFITEDDIMKFLPKYLPLVSELKPAGTDSHGQPQDETDSIEAPDFLVDLNARASEGRLDPVIGRKKEIRAVMEILGRRNKNNPVLVGDPGVGKTAVIEGLADMVVKGQVPDTLQGKTIYSLDFGLLMAGTKFRGEFEERIKALVEFMKSRAGQAVLFIDEIHLLVGAGKTEGAMDAANLLKPALARGELQCIGATTFDEHKKYIRSDGALERRFRPVPVHEPSKEDAIEILLGIKDKFSIHHGVEISDEAIYASVFLSSQYIQDRFLPDKAIDLIDEAASSLKLSAESMPPHLVELESEVRAKRVYQRAKNSDGLAEEIASLEKQFAAEKTEWEQEVFEIKRHSELKNKLDLLRAEQEKCESQQDYERASQIKFSELPKAQSELEKLKFTFELGRAHVAGVLSRHTGIPAEKILMTKQESILDLPAFLSSRVYGQAEATQEIGQVIMAAHAGVTDPTRPMASFLLTGPTGVGKTETAKSLADFLFQSKDKIIRVDLSEYAEKHAVAKLIGSPAGYVGYDDGGVLTEAVRKTPYAVVLFDEIEKAHPDFADILLQILDDGRLTDNKGRVVSFRNTIIMITTNAGAPEEAFKPEVLGRLDAVLKYNRLQKDALELLVDRELQALNDRLEDKKIQLKLSEALVEKICKQGWDPSYGARPLKSCFSRLVVRPLSTKILKGEIQAGAYLAESVDLGGVFFQPLREPLSEKPQSRADLH